MSEWIDIEERLPLGPSTLLMVRKENGEEIIAYYHKDKMAWLNNYCNKKRSHFQNKKTLEFLFDVTHWKSS